MKIRIKGPVGEIARSSGQSINQPDDIRAIWNAFRSLELVSGVSESSVEPKILALTQSIRDFQGLFMTKTDGRIDPHGRTLRLLNKLLEGKTIIVNLNRQTLYTKNHGTPVKMYSCASGDREHPTPPGIFHVERKHRTYRSKKYDAQMDFAMFFHGGYAIHKSQFVGPTSWLKRRGFESLGSHGCVRLEHENAEALFDWTPLKTSVVIRSG